MTDPNKKTPRNFQCRDELWHRFEFMARELECSVDYLINDAMKQYARQRGYMTPSTSSQSMPPPPPSSVHGAAPPPPAAPPRTTQQSGAHAHPLAGAPPPPAAPPPPHAAPPPPTPPQAAPPPPAPRPPAPPPPSMAPQRPPTGPAAPPSLAPTTVPKPPQAPPAPASSAGRRPPPPPAAVRAPGPPSLPGGAPPPMPGAATAPAPTTGGLSIQYQGEGFRVTKDRFVIGRGKQSSDLTIKDPNVSRQHAMIEFAGGHYYMVDMGSTNGIEFQGRRVQRKAIENGDVFRICDHELTMLFG